VSEYKVEYRVRDLKEAVRETEVVDINQKVGAGA